MSEPTPAQPERCPTCGCELAYPNAVHMLDCDPQPAPEADEREALRGPIRTGIARAVSASQAGRDVVDDMADKVTDAVQHYLAARRSQPAPRTVTAEDDAAAASRADAESGGYGYRNSPTWRRRYLAALGVTVEAPR